jgi:hypothetical protein
MNCCINCFKDTFIKEVIKKEGKKGNCDFCPGKDTFVLDIAKESNPVSEKIIQLVEIYSPSKDPEAKLLKESLRDDWDIFSADAETIQRLLEKLCFSSYPKNSEIFTQKVYIPSLADEGFLKEYAVVRDFDWRKFSDSIKHKNRFHNGMVNVDAFASFFTAIDKKYPKKTKLFRARIAISKDGFEASDMGPPPKDKRTAGRVNPDGIGILYLSDDETTALHEVHARALDFVTIGEFRALHDIKVVNLSGFSSISPYNLDMELAGFAVNRKIFQEIAFEIAKPQRRSDSPLEYLPTQYIAEYIKSQDYDGVEYASTLCNGGKNIAVFNEALFECVGVKTIEITKLEYDKKTL